jgi:isopentenyl diphosphate isomerase/L-lactate dehydrogenase-like FMN-dependent dehydrogenase
LIEQTLLLGAKQCPRWRLRRHRAAVGHDAGGYSVLPEIVDSVADAVEIYVDGGIRRGTDVLKALAYGARAVFVGRPILWGVAVGGEAGVTTVLEILRKEFDLAMAYRAARP